MKPVFELYQDRTGDIDFAADKCPHCGEMSFGVNFAIPAAVCLECGLGFHFSEYGKMADAATKEQ